MAAPLVSRAVTYAGRGGVDVIAIKERLVPAPEAGEVRLRVKAAAVNPTDIVLRDPPFAIPSHGDAAPPVPGVDAAGFVESVGPGETRLRVGDRVMAVVSHMRPQGGAQSDYIVVPAASVVTIPDSLSLSQAATLPMNGLTALLALDIAALVPGQWLGITGGAGFLAYNMIVLAKQRGLRVIADAKPDEAALLRSHGVDIVVDRGIGFADAVRNAVPEGVTTLLDTARLNDQVFAALADGGTHIPVRPFNVPAPRGIKITPVFVPSAMDRTDWLEMIRDLAVAGILRPLIAKEYSLTDVAEAQRALEAGGLRGRPVLIF